MSGGIIFASNPIKHAAQKTTDINGLWSGTVLPGLRYWVQPMTAGEFANSLTISGSTATVQFKKFKAGGLGITLGTLLSVQAFEDVSGTVTFNIVGSEDC